MLLGINLRRRVMIPENSMEEKIKDILKAGHYSEGFAPASGECPKDEELADYISGEIAPDRKEKIATHISRCQRCLDIAAVSLRALNDDTLKKDTGLTQSIVKKASLIPKKYPKKNTQKISILKRNKYLIIAGVFFVLSFIVKIYFMQLLLAAGVFGVKWIMDTGSTRALIMIYDAWKSRKDDDSDSDGDALSVPDRQPRSGKPHTRL